MSEQTERCDKCKWWVVLPEDDNAKPYSDDDEDAVGECKRYPPTSEDQSRPHAFDPLAWSSPPTFRVDFCGEFAPTTTAPNIPEVQLSSKQLARLWGYTDSRPTIFIIEAIQPLVNEYSADEVCAIFKIRADTKKHALWHTLYGLLKG